LKKEDNDEPGEIAVENVLPEYVTQGTGVNDVKNSD
jgi:hypothetical protein